MPVVRISKPNSLITKIWSTKYKENLSYRLFSYVIELEHKDGVLLLNTVTGELVLISANDRDNPSGDILKELVEKHFFVPCDIDDKKSVNQLRLLVSQITKKNHIIKYIILPTTACNARCFYCFEAGCKQSSMSHETADKVVDFIVAKSTGHPISIRWFGGEPMVGEATIDYICDKLTTRGVKFTSLMTSNGYLFNENNAVRAHDKWNLKKVQITLDGTEEIYNKTKNYTNPKEGISPFCKVLDNIDLLSQNDIEVDIRLNVSLYNYADINLLIDQLYDRFGGKKNIRAYSKVLFENVGFEPLDFDNQTNEKIFFENKKITKKLISCGFAAMSNSLPSLKYASCMADNDSSIVIAPSGELAKCEQHCIDMLVGDVDHGIEPENNKLWKEKISWDICETCPLYACCYKLKRCDTAIKCEPYQVEYKLSGLKNIMNQKYEEYLQNSSAQEYLDENDDFQD